MISKLRNKITLTPVTEGDMTSSGDYELVQGSPVTLWADIKPISAEKAERMGRTGAFTGYEVIIRASNIVNDKAIFTIDGKDYEIENLEPADKFGRFMKLIIKQL